MCFIDDNVFEWDSLQGRPLPLVLHPGLANDDDVRLRSGIVKVIANFEIRSPFATFSYPGSYDGLSMSRQCQYQLSEWKIRND